jgi:hypothetical protein
MKSKAILGIALILVLAGCLKKTSPSVADQATARDSDTRKRLSPLPSRPLSPESERLRQLASLKASQIRGLSFNSPVQMTELSGWEYGSRAGELAAMIGGDDLRSLSNLAAAGGILPEGTDLGSLAATFAAFSASATYSPFDKQVLLVSRFRDESLLTHEFTHALQDQHFDLLKLLGGRPFSFDHTEAIFAVVEGDAMNVQRRAEAGAAYEKRPLEAIERQENARFDEYRKTAAMFFQPLVTETFVFRYRDGARFVEAVRRARGQKGVDDLFVHPPASTEQILHFDKFLAGEQPKEVSINEEALHADGWRLNVSTPLGEIGIRGLLMSGVDGKQAVSAASGWGGDRSYLFEKDGMSPLFVWYTVWDKPSDANEFFEAYKALKLHEGGAQAMTPSVSSETEARWSQNGRTTIVKRSGESVVVMRGGDAEVPTAFAMLTE